MPGWGVSTARSTNSCSFSRGNAPHVNNVELGRFGRNRSNVWHYAGVNTFGKDRDAELEMHPTVKPLALVRLEKRRGRMIGKASPARTPRAAPVHRRCGNSCSVRVTPREKSRGG
jgi:hypothetical protein